MSLQPLHILIAEPQPLLQQRMTRHLNELGYRRITQVTSLRELLDLTHYSYEPFEAFDLLIINGELLSSAGADPHRFFMRNAQVRHGLIHDARRGQEKPELLFTSCRRQLSLIRTPDRQTLQAFMQSLEW
jgi:hypothetical protein